LTLIGVAIAGKRDLALLETLGMSGILSLTLLIGISPRRDNL
jgi:hypothetical protein